MTTDPHIGLSAREREILDILYRLHRATAEEVLAEMGSPPSNATVRSTLRVLEEKGHITHERDGVRFVYSSTTPVDDVRTRALRHVVKTFFDGSAAQAAAALLGDEAPLDADTRARMTELIEELEREGR